MDRAGIPTIRLVAKEGLALINGTPILTAMGTFALWDGMLLLKQSDIAAALTMEANRGIIDALTNGSIRSVLIAASLIRPTTSAAS